MADNASSLATKIAIALGVLLLIAAGVFFGQKYLMRTPTQPDVKVGQVVAEEFLQHARSTNPGKAWDGSTAEFKSIEGRESFLRKVRANPVLKEPLQFVSSQQVLIADQPRAEYEFQSPQAKTVRVLIGYENGEWKVDRLTL